MLITETPLRVSFLGGGTDYPAHFEQHGGAVLGTAIDKSAYLSVAKFHSTLFDYSIRISYRKVECVKKLEELEHAPFRECLRWCNVERDVEVDYTAELPAYTGLGSSSTFVVGLLNSLNAYQGKAMRPMDLAYEAIRLERDVLGESVGCQDQVFAAVGGFNVIEFRATDDIVVNRIPISPERRRDFQSHLMVFFTGIKRRADALAKKYVANAAAKRGNLLALRKCVDDGYGVLATNGSLAPFGELLHQSWLLKRDLADGVSNREIEQIYDAGLDAGALGGKLLGAGGGGFVLFFVPPERHESVRCRLQHLTEIDIGINAPGSHIIHA